MAKQKCEVFLEFQDGKQIDMNAIMENIKKRWTQGGGKIKDMTDFRVYLKPSENKAYYTIGGVADSIDLA